MLGLDITRVGFIVLSSVRILKQQEERKMGIGITIGLVAVVVVLFLVIIGIYNKLVALRNRFKNAFSQIDVQLKRRYDLIPNLVETAKAYMSHERETLEAVISARNQASSASQKAAANPDDPGAMQGLLGAESLLSGAMGKLLVTVERYPDLKANQTMSQLMEELTSTENKISFARQAYNDSVMTYNTARETFPNVLLAGPMGFKGAVLFEVKSEAEREAPKVSF
jgi:LemA protein